MASCVVPGAPPYVDVYRIEFGGNWPTVKMFDVGGMVMRSRAIHMLSMPQSADMWSSPVLRTGEEYALRSPSQGLFNGLLAQLARYHFFDMNDLDSEDPDGASSDYTITAARCGTKHTVHLTLSVNAMTLDSNTQTIVSLFNDLLHTMLLSNWLHIATVTT
jgi:hypothetical protein